MNYLEDSLSYPYNVGTKRDEIRRWIRVRWTGYGLTCDRCSPRTHYNPHVNSPIHPLDIWPGCKYDPLHYLYLKCQALLLKEVWFRDYLCTANKHKELNPRFFLNKLHIDIWIPWVSQHLNRLMQVFNRWQQNGRQFLSLCSYKY